MPTLSYAGVVLGQLAVLLILVLGFGFLLSYAGVVLDQLVVLLILVLGLGFLVSSRTSKALW